MIKLIREENNQFLEIVKKEFINWSKDRNIETIGFVCNFTADYFKRKDFNSNEDLINSFFEHINGITIISKRPKFEETNDNIRVSFKFLANRGGENYKATGTFSLR